MVTRAGTPIPWDVLGDPDFADRVAQGRPGHGHPGRDLPLAPGPRPRCTRRAGSSTPGTPRSTGRSATRPGPGSGCAPLAPALDGRARPVRVAAADVLPAAGFRVNAWIVLTHNTRLGTAHPDVAVVNCFGERYPYALCPASPRCATTAATLAAEAVRDAAGRRRSRWRPAARWAWRTSATTRRPTAPGRRSVRALLSVCCCAACRAAWSRARAATADRPRCVARAAARPRPPPAEERPRAERCWRSDHGTRQPPMRCAARCWPRYEQLRACRSPCTPTPIPGRPARRRASPRPRADDVDALLVPGWPTTEATADLVRQAAAHARPWTPTSPCFPRPTPEALPEHVRRLRAAGASRLSLYHLGLVPSRQLDLLQRMAKEFRL